MTNPYASFLAGRDPLDVIEATPARVGFLLETMGPGRAEQEPAPGKWSAREILCHLADCEVAFAFRLRQTLAEDRHVMQPFDQVKWAKSYSVYGLDEALAAFSALRQWNVALVRSLNAADFGKSVNHPERGDMTFGTIVETIAGHDLNHLVQIETIAGRGAAQPG